MKMRYVVFLYTAVILLLLFRVIFQKETEEGGMDMVRYNEAYRRVTEELAQAVDRETVEAENGCHILLFSDEDYKSRLHEMLVSQAVILDYERDGEILGKVCWQTGKNRYERLRRELHGQEIFLCVALLFAGYALFFYIYCAFIRPFSRLQKFSAQVAKGNLEVPLPMQKHNYFGAFTESFDLMREELKRARESEYQANISKKELVAELSHDIKTPVATIKAVCELVQAKEKNPETLEKVEVIASRAEMIEHLVDNMFHATMEELKALKVEAEAERSTVIAEMFERLKYYGEIRFVNDCPQCLLYMDRLRLSQVIDNVVNNSYKYAGTPVTVSFLEEAEGIQVLIKDSGPGICEEELALATEKFYRGSNAAGKTGSGLGLYLAKTFMEQMRGGMEVYNDNGFAVVLFLRKV